MFYLIAVCEVPEAAPYEPDGFIGVDLGIVNIATTSTSYQPAGRSLNRYRKRQLALRVKLQKKRTKSAKRRLKERSRREQRHVKNTSHIIAKTIVTEAERTFAGLSLEELKGIRQRVRLRKPQRVALQPMQIRPSEGTPRSPGATGDLESERPGPAVVFQEHRRCIDYPPGPCLSCQDQRTAFDQAGHVNNAAQALTWSHVQLFTAVHRGCPDRCGRSGGVVHPRVRGHGPLRPLWCVVHEVRPGVSFSRFRVDAASAQLHHGASRSR
ncbi:hypothetical protein ACIRU3_38515 [Streptomyces sp. NPDC101151]|uniref:hypothetical protein n=1 Tax=Streptomyces sp. NPDC101151 TaxID=3366115 RepID=UPI0038026297